MADDSGTSATAPNGLTVPTDAVVIGAGPAGLAVAACLRRAGVPFALLERADRVGAAWHRHYRRLHLHTDKRHSCLPYLPFADDVPRYPSRAQVIAYLDAYARRFGLEPRLGQEVVAVGRRDGHWETRTGDARYVSPAVVVATGHARLPHRPSWPGQDAFRGQILHSAEYEDGAPFRGQQVLVVGLGNSGGELAIDLWEHGAAPSIAVRGPVNVVPRDFLGLPILTWAVLLGRLPAPLADALTRPLVRLATGDLTRLGLTRPPHGPLAQVERRGRIPLVDVGTLALIRRGDVAVWPALEAFTPDGVVLADGSRRPVDAVVLATGYRPRVEAFLEEAERVVGANGIPRCSGREADLPGLYFCGFRVAPTGVLREIAREAPRIARDIARTYASSRSR